MFRKFPGVDERIRTSRAVGAVLVQKQSLRQHTILDLTGEGLVKVLSGSSSPLGDKPPSQTRSEASAANPGRRTGAFSEIETQRWKPDQ